MACCLGNEGFFNLKYWVFHENLKVCYISLQHHSGPVFQVHNHPILRFAIEWLHEIYVLHFPCLFWSKTTLNASDSGFDRLSLTLIQPKKRSGKLYWKTPNKISVSFFRLFIFKCHLLILFLNSNVEKFPSNQQIAIVVGIEETLQSSIIQP